ncbi:MAG: hypothetical protein IPN89_02910 [Saprospiraceae bacterium]|nr:hypothetical protein [Saprospiraceae bacterium]
MKYFYIMVCLCFSYCISFAQKENAFYTYKNEIGINFTNVLGNVLSLNPNNASSPYGLTYRRHMKNSSFRSALNIRYGSNQTNDFSSGSFFQRTLNILTTNVRFGLEKHLVVHKKLQFSYGFDVLVSYGRENSEIIDLNTNGSTFLSNQKTIGGGLGPMLRLEYKISDRIYISSESSLYGIYNTTNESLTINGSLTEEPSKKASSLILELPQSLFFNISF